MYGFVTNIFLNQLALLDSLQLAAGATGLFSQGADSGWSWVFCLSTGPNFR